MTNQNEEEQVPGADEHVPTQGEINYQRFLDSQALAVRQWNYDLDEAHATGRMYRGVHPEVDHLQFLWDRSLGLRRNPGPLPTPPIAERSEVGEELWHRTHVGYFLEIFYAFLAGRAAGSLPVFLPNAYPAASFPGFAHLAHTCGFTHDSLEWGAEVEIKTFDHGRHNDTIIHYHIPVDGAIFLRQIPGQQGRQIRRHGRPYHLVGRGHDVPQGFLDYARAFFGGRTPNQLIYYCPRDNRFVLVYRVKDILHSQPRQVDLKICFEPGWPTEPFDEDAWFAAQEMQPHPEDPDV